MEFEIRNNPSQSRFEATVDGKTAAAEYRLDNDTLVLTHTNVPPEITTRGVASAMIQHALEHAKKEELKVVPQCSFAAAYIQRHPEYQELVRR